VCVWFSELVILVLKSIAVVVITVVTNNPFAEVLMVAATEFVAHRALSLVAQAGAPAKAGVSCI
jgi:hypothetical protein